MSHLIKEFNVKVMDQLKIEDMSIQQLKNEGEFYESLVRQFYQYPMQRKSSQDQLDKINELIKERKLTKLIKGE